MDFEPNYTFEQQFLFSPDTYSALMQAAGEVDDRFKDIAPRVTGNMVRSAHAEMFQGRRGWECVYDVPVVSPDGAEYAKFVEFGTKNDDGSTRQHAQHNLKHSLEYVQAQHQGDDK